MPWTNDFPVDAAPTYVIPHEASRATQMLIAGDLTVTVRSLKSGEHITVRCVAKRKRANRWERCRYELATHVFITVRRPDETAWPDKIGTWYPQSRRFYADDNVTPARLWAAAQVIRYAGAWTTCRRAEFFTEDYCGRCGSPLTDPESITRGFGPHCYGRATGSEHQMKRDPVGPIEHHYPQQSLGVD